MPHVYPRYVGGWSSLTLPSPRFKQLYLIHIAKLIHADLRAMYGMIDEVKP